MIRRSVDGACHGPHLGQVTDDAVIRGIFTPAFALLQEREEVEATLPAGPLGYGVKFAVLFAGGKEMSVTVTPQRRRGAGACVRAVFGEGRGATKVSLSMDGEVSAPKLASYLGTMRRHLDLPPPGLTPAELAEKINAVHGADPHRGLRLKVRDGELVLSAQDQVTPKQAHVMLAAARVCGLLVEADDGGGLISQAVSTLHYALVEHASR